MRAFAQKRQGDKRRLSASLEADDVETLGKGGTGKLESKEGNLRDWASAQLPRLLPAKLAEEKQHSLAALP